MITFEVRFLEKTTMVIPQNMTAPQMINKIYQLKYNEPP